MFVHVNLLNGMALRLSNLQGAIDRHGKFFLIGDSNRNIEMTKEKAAESGKATGMSFVLVSGNKKKPISLHKLGASNFQPAPSTLTDSPFLPSRSGPGPRFNSETFRMHAKRRGTLQCSLT